MAEIFPPEAADTARIVREENVCVKYSLQCDHNIVVAVVVVVVIILIPIKLTFKI